MTTQAADVGDVALKVRVAEEVRALMGRRNMSRVKLAERLGQSRTYVGRRLSGETAFDLDDLENIAGVFGVTVGSLMGDGASTPPPPPPIPLRPDPEASTCRNSPDTAAAVIELPRWGRAA